MRIVATPEAVEHVRTSGGQVFVWPVPMIYAYGFEQVFTLEAATDPPGAEREFIRFEGEGIQLLYDPADKGTPDSIHLVMVGRSRKKLRAYWNGNSFGRET